MTCIKRTFAILFLVYFSTREHAYSQDISSLRVLPVIDVSNKKTVLDLPRDKSVVLLVLGADCPITQKYVPTIENLKRTFAGVSFVGLFPKQFTNKDVAGFIDEYGVSFPCFIDPDMQIINLLGASVTPEVFLISGDTSILYAGAIDNWFFSLGSYRTNITRHYLRDAINAHLRGNEIRVPRTEAIGCPVPQNAAQRKDAPHHH